MNTLFGPERDRRFSVSLTQHDGVLVVQVAGELDPRTSPVLRERLRPVWGQADLRAVVLDTAGLEFCDSVGLSEIITTLKRCEAAGMRFLLSGVHGVLARVLTLTGLRRAFEIHDSAAEAIRAAAGA
ncbi:anti-sigma factor antagonist [Planomonospora corallina]|uniref:Anti-sigma factor antagonist n=1 Tax=Planomonospora corallina TaxID=1806052 RepID=A0ABV8IEU8_9ACTN